MAREPATNPATVADRLADAGLRVRPLVFHEDYPYLRVDDGSYSVAFRRGLWRTYRNGLSMSTHETKEDAIAACDAHNAAAVLAMLEVVPSEDAKP